MPKIKPAFPAPKPKGKATDQYLAKQWKKEQGEKAPKKGK